MGLFFKTAGTRFAIYPLDKLFKEFDGEFFVEPGILRSFTAAHNVRSKLEDRGDLWRESLKNITPYWV